MQNYLKMLKTMFAKVGSYTLITISIHICLSPFQIQ